MGPVLLAKLLSLCTQSAAKVGIMAAAAHVDRLSQLPEELLVHVLKRTTLATRLSLCFSANKVFRQLAQSPAFDPLFSTLKLLDCQPGCGRYRDALSHAHVDTKCVVACCDVNAWPLIVSKCFGSRLVSLDVSPETNADLPLVPLKKLLSAAPSLLSLRAAYIKNLNSSYVREIAKRLPKIEWLDLNAGGMIKGLGPDGETALIHLAERCRSLKFLRIQPAKHFVVGNAVHQLVHALPELCMLTNNGWMNGLYPRPSFPNGFGSPPIDDVPEWHDYGNSAGGSDHSNSPLGTEYLQSTASLHPHLGLCTWVARHATVEEWRAAHGKVTKEAILRGVGLQPNV